MFFSYGQAIIDKDENVVSWKCTKTGYLQKLVSLCTANQNGAGSSWKTGCRCHFFAVFLGYTG